jgi:NAD(P)H-nitrite reductase large subunit
MMHANKQRDGSYSIVPQMQGGLTTPSELKALANAERTSSMVLTVFSALTYSRTSALE